MNRSSAPLTLDNSNFKSNRNDKFDSKEQLDVKQIMSLRENPEINEFVMELEDIVRSEGFIFFSKYQKPETDLITVKNF